MSNREGSLVWLTEERCFGFVAGPLDAYYTLIRWVRGGLEHEEFVENNEFQIIGELNEYDNDDDE